MLEWLRFCFLKERRKKTVAVFQDRRSEKMTVKSADQQLYDSIDRFSRAVIERQESRGIEVK